MLSRQAAAVNDNRFLVEAWWWDSDGGAGEGGPMKLTDESNCFRFFAADNVELIAKVLDGCAINDRFWVFAAGLTDVGLSLTVTDTVTGEQATDMNALGEAYQPVQDTAAFDICE